MNPAPRRPNRQLIVAIASLGFAAPGCQGGEPATPAVRAAPSVPEGSGVDAGTAALLADLDKSPTRVLRAIAMLRPGAQAKAQAVAALKAAGAASAHELGAQPMLVIEVNAAQLRALLATGQVLRVQPDTPVPTN